MYLDAAQGGRPLDLAGLDAASVVAFVSAIAKRYTYTTLFALLATTGLPISEALGLTCSDVDLHAGILTVAEDALADVRARLECLARSRGLDLYRHEPVKSGWPRPGTIHWHVAHLEACKREYTAAMLSQGPGGQGEAAAPATTFAEAVERLARAHAAQREVIRSLSEGDLTRLVQDGMRLDEFLASTIRHDTWHAAQIAVVRRLWRTREGQAGPS